MGQISVRFQKPRRKLEVNKSQVLTGWKELEMDHFFRHKLIPHLRELENSSYVPSLYTNNGTDSWENRTYFTEVKLFGGKTNYLLLLFVWGFLSNKKVVSLFLIVCTSVESNLFQKLITTLLRCNEIWFSLEYWMNKAVLELNIMQSLFIIRSLFYRSFFLFAKVFDRLNWFVLFLVCLL